AVVGLPHLTQGQYAASPARHPDPLIEHASFGWLPAGFAHSGVEKDEVFTQTMAAPTSDAVRATLPAGTRDVAYISLMEARGTRPDLDKLTGGLWAHRTVAPPVNGHPAYWVVPPGRASVGQVYDAELWWQNQPGHWVAVETVGLIPADIAGTVGRIARTITFDRARPVPMPLRVTGLPAGLTVTSANVMVEAAHGFWWSSLGFTDGRGGRLSITVRHSAAGARDPKTGPGEVVVSAKHPVPQLLVYRDITVDGHQAVLRPDGMYLVVYGVRGADISLEVTNPGNADQRLPHTAAGLTALYRQVTFLGTDPATWTTAPLG
ncbi:MAG TPA: hypothetical protein VNW94_14075, partial [Streptosporangiaceae bacterium]|nr:hypothetical protein [Streptosporangiaceae bacterium]